MSEVILVCRCSGSKEQAETAFKIAFPYQELPPVVRGADNIARLAEEYQDTDYGKYIKVISKKSGKFAYYLKERAGSVEMTYDLFKGKKVV